VELVEKFVMEGVTAVAVPMWITSSRWSNTLPDTKSAKATRRRTSLIPSPGGNGTTTPTPDDGTNELSRGSSTFITRPSGNGCSNTKLAVSGRLAVAHATGTRTLRPDNAVASILVTLLVKLVIPGTVLLCAAAFAKVLPHPN